MLTAKGLQQIKEIAVLNFYANRLISGNPKKLIGYIYIFFFYYHIYYQGSGLKLFFTYT